MLKQQQMAAAMTQLAFDITHFSHRDWIWALFKKWRMHTFWWRPRLLGETARLFDCKLTAWEMCLACLRQPAQRWHSSAKTLTNNWWERNARVEIVSTGRRWEMSEQWAQNCLNCRALSTNMKWRKKATSCLFSSIKNVVSISSYIVICSYFMTYLFISGLYVSLLRVKNT